MVQMRQIAYVDFILFKADQQVAEAVAVVKKPSVTAVDKADQQVAETDLELWKLQVTAVIVRHRQRERADYYLYLAQDFHDRLALVDSAQPLGLALNLQQTDATP